MTKVLILQHVRPEPPARILSALDGLNVSAKTVRLYRGETVPGTFDADALVVMGGPMGVGDRHDRAHLRSELQLIEEALNVDAPVLGVCLGSQLLAHVLGADVRSAPAKEIGWEQVALREAAADDSLFRDVSNPFTAFHWHGDVFGLPTGAVSLARTSDTPHPAFRYGETAYGLLFHLEVTPKTVAWMTKAFQDELAEEGLDGSAIRRAAMSYESEVRSVAQKVFGEWAKLVTAR